MRAVSYINLNTPFTRGVPNHLQRMLMAGYCERQGIEVVFEQLEIEVMTHMPTLMSLLEDHRPEAVVLFSVYALPPKAETRAKLLAKAVEKGVTLVFANEETTLESADDVVGIEELFAFHTFGDAATG